MGFEPTNGGFADLAGFAILLIRFARYPASTPLFVGYFALFVLKFVLTYRPNSSLPSRLQLCTLDRNMPRRHNAWKAY